MVVGIVRPKPAKAPAVKRAGGNRGLFWRWALLVAATGAAYHYSLTSLVEQLGSETPLAYLGLIPLLAAAVAWLRPARGLQAPGNDEEFNILIGLGFLIPALIGLAVLPIQMGAAYWAYRFDILTLPLFLAGAVTLLFGYDALRACKRALLFTGLAWPYPYYLLLSQPVQALTAATSFVTSIWTGILGIAQSTGQTGVFMVTSPDGPVPVAIGVACAGLAGLVGFALIGLCLCMVCEGSWRQKLTWLAVGLAASFLVNVFRIVLLLLLVGRVGVAWTMNVVHPVAGLILDTGVLVVMLTLLGRFGLRFHGADPKRWEAVRFPRLGVAPLALLLLLSLPLSMADSSLKVLSPMTGTDGGARIVAFVKAQPHVSGWTLSRVRDINWAGQYFGPNSSWERYSFDSPGGETVWADVVRTDNDSFSQYPVEGCLAFHGDHINALKKVSIGQAMSATLIDYTDAQTHLRWSMAYWIWPVKVDGKDYKERIWLSYGAEGSPSLNLATASAQSSPFDQTRFGLVNTMFDLSFNGNRLTRGDQQLVDFATELRAALVPTV